MSGRFFVRWSSVGYVTDSARGKYERYPGAPGVRSWATRGNAERFLARKDPQWASSCQIVEAPEFWRRRQPTTDAEWDALAGFLGEASGTTLRASTTAVDAILAEVFRNERT